MRALIGALCLFLLFMSGCIGGGASTVATEFAALREKAILPGLLAPTGADERETYRQGLVSFRSRVNALGGREKTALSAYLDGSLSLLNMITRTEEGLSLLENVNPDFIECSAGSPASKAIASLEDAREAAQSAQSYFQTVQQNPTLTNALGADYVLNASQTSEAIVQIHAERVNELKIACGFSV